MNLQLHLEKMKNIQISILNYLDKEDNVEENYQNLIQVIQNNQLVNDRHLLKTFLRLILKISKHHHRSIEFFPKIEHTLEFLKNDIKKNFSNSEIFTIFKTSKKILLFLIKEKIIIVDDWIVSVITSAKYKERNYHFYFFPEIRPFIDTNLINEIKSSIPNNFEELRTTGKTENYVYEVIKSDSIEEFITYVKQTNYQLKTKLKASMFETNAFLMKRESSLIELSAFFGSTQILKYLYMNNVLLSSSLWIFGIHSDNPEIIDILRENRIEPIDSTYRKCEEESIKCHHNEMANYFMNNFSNSKNDHKILELQNQNNFLYRNNNHNKCQQSFYNNKYDSRNIYRNSDQFGDSFYEPNFQHQKNFYRSKNFHQSNQNSYNQSRSSYRKIDNNKGHFNNKRSNNRNLARFGEYCYESDYRYFNDYNRNNQKFDDLSQNFNDIEKVSNEVASIDDDISEISFRYYNYAFFPTDFNDKFYIFHLCHYDYFKFVELYLNEKQIDINATVILNQNIFFYKIQNYLNY